MKLSEYLETNRITAAEFGRQIGLSRSNALRLAKGQRSPSLRVLRLIEQKTGGAVGLADFAGEEAAA